MGNDQSKDLRHHSNRYGLDLVGSGKLLACQKGSDEIYSTFWIDHNNIVKRRIRSLRDQLEYNCKGLYERNNENGLSW